MEIFEPIHVLKLEGKPRIKKTSTIQSKNICSTNNDWAVIINGGMSAYWNWERYWNHISSLYETLINEYNFNEYHIFVLCSDGINAANDRHLHDGGYDSSPLDLDGDGDNDIQYSATRTNIHNVFTILENSLSSSDNLFIYTTDHGGIESGDNVYLNNVKSKFLEQ